MIIPISIFFSYCIIIISFKILSIIYYFSNNLCSNHRITIIDFPGFGESDEPSTPWTIDDYSLLIENLVKALNIRKPVVMGHSFGGRVAIRFSANNPIEKLVLFGSPCIRENKKLPLSTRILKKLKTLPGMDKLGEEMKKYIGSRDYKAASPIMRQTLVNVINEDLSSYARKIEPDYFNYLEKKYLKMYKTNNPLQLTQLTNNNITSIIMPVRIVKDDEKKLYNDRINSIFSLLEDYHEQI